MNILLNIPEETAAKYQMEADKEKRSRKNLMEKVLIDFFQIPQPTNIPDSKKQFQEQYSPTPKVNQYDAYYIEINSCGNVSQIQRTVGVMKGDSSLPDWQKQKLEKFAIEKSRTMDV